MIEDSIQCYHILGVEPGASAKRIREAYQELTSTWNPERYAHNPRLQFEAKKKRDEIDEAYKSIQFFLPELKDKEHPQRKVKRIFRNSLELSVGPTVERTRMLLGVLVALILVFMGLWARRVYQDGTRLAPAQSTDVPGEP